MDLISRQQAIDAECEVCQIAPKKERGHNCTYYVHGCKEIECLRALPSAQTEIIHCRDCKHSSVITLFSHSMLACHRRPYDVVSIEPDDYCSYAQKKTDTAITTGIGISTYAGGERDG